MISVQRAALALSLGLFLIGQTSLASAATTVAVSLWDKNPAAEMDMSKMVPMVPGMMEPAALAEAIKTATMGITIDQMEVPAGEVTFVVTNDSTSVEHEMLVAPMADPTKPLPYDQAKARVDESLSNDLGEVSELAPNTSGSLTLTLTPGTYLLYCNIKGHYAMGMWTLLTVTQ